MPQASDYSLSIESALNVMRHCEGGTTEAILHPVYEIASGKSPRNDNLYKIFLLNKLY
jgi:hypothetical protein